MRPLSTSELLKAWERGLAQRRVEQAMILLAAACSEGEPRELAQLSIGERDALLLSLRESTFGPQLISLVVCPECGEQLELSFTVAELRFEHPHERPPVLSLSSGDFEVEFRLPNSLDLAALNEGQEISDGTRLLLERCLLRARQGEEKRTLEELPPELLEHLVDEMARRDPQADIRLSLSCPQCRHQWQTVFDIVSFFWSEISVWAARMLREVHALASAYGWREEEILSLSPWRRQAYLELING